MASEWASVAPVAMIAFRIPNPIDQHVGLRDLLYRLVIGYVLTRGVVAIGKQQDDLTPLSSSKTLRDSLVYGFINAGAPSRLAAIDGRFQLLGVVDEIRQVSNPLIEPHDHHPVVGPERLDELDGSLLDILQAAANALAQVDQHRNIQRDLFISKEGDLLSGSVLG